jgi:hypothetical protein
MCALTLNVFYTFIDLRKCFVCAAFGSLTKNFLPLGTDIALRDAGEKRRPHVADRVRTRRKIAGSVKEVGRIRERTWINEP